MRRSMMAILGNDYVAPAIPDYKKMSFLRGVHDYKPP